MGVLAWLQYPRRRATKAGGASGMPGCKMRSRPAGAGQRAGLGAAGWRRDWSLVARVWPVAACYLGCFVLRGVHCALCVVRCVMSCVVPRAAASASALSHAPLFSDCGLAACPPFCVTSCPEFCLLPPGVVRSAHVLRHGNSLGGPRLTGEGGKRGWW